MSQDDQFAGYRTRFLREWGHLYYGWLRAGLWHTTSFGHYRGIRETGVILPNTNNRRFTYPQSARSYGVQRGYICLFDFASVTDEQLMYYYDRWTVFFPYGSRRCRVALQLDRAQLADRLIPNQRAHETGFSTMWIPHVEAWYPGPIPIAAITGYLLATPGPDPLLLGPEHPLHEALRRPRRRSARE